MRKLTNSDRKAIHSMLTARPKPKIATRKIISREAPKTKNHLKFPYHSDALGVSPDAIPQAMEEMRKRGIALDFDKHGRAIITGPAQYHAIGKAVGYKTGRDGWENIRSGRESARGREALRQAVANHLHECEESSRYED